MAYQVLYRLTGRLTENNAARTLVPAQVEEQGGDPVSFRFLNREVTFLSPAAIDWNYAELGKLWTYNLNYFEFLDPRDAARGRALIAAWIAAEPVHKDGWEPYPTSLRLVNWIRFYVGAELAVSAAVKASVRRQYDALWRKREFHLGGNHLLENALALSLTARFLEDEAGAKRADRLLSTELAGQYLPDGAHYELSPMYHLILLERMLTVYHCLTTFTAPAPAPEILQTLQTSLTRQLGWAAAFCTADGRYAHFNDSTDGIAPPLADLLARASALGLSARTPPLGASGYRRWSQGPFDLWIDAAAIGPDDIPGHAHADNLTFVLHVGGRPVIVDPAISTYEKNERRAWERSTAAHNTVTVSDRNSSDVWGGFRVGRRARTTLAAEAPGRMTAVHTGYGIPHRRTYALGDAGLEISDELSKDKTGTARFHFYHGLQPRLSPTGCVLEGLRITWSSGAARLVPYRQAVGWNEVREAWCLEVTFTGGVNFRVATDFSP